MRANGRCHALFPLSWPPDPVKMIPVMLFGVLFAKKRYTLQEYLCVALITAGIVTFNLSGPHKQVSSAPVLCRTSDKAAHVRGGEGGVNSPGMTMVIPCPLWRCLFTCKNICFPSPIPYASGQFFRGCWFAIPHI